MGEGIACNYLVFQGSIDICSLHISIDGCSVFSTFVSLVVQHEIVTLIYVFAIS